MLNANDSALPPSNRILAALPKQEYKRLLPHLKYVELPLSKVLHEPDKPLPYVYFPYSGIVSITAMMNTDLEIDVGVVGREGMVGLPVVMGTDSIPLRAVMQISGNAMRIKSALFTKELKHCAEASRMLLRYAQAFFIQTAMIAACNTLHQLDGRLARWLLVTQDRANSSELPLTQELLAVMLGVSRPHVSQAASQMQADGLISYSRGQIHIIDQRGLEAASCQCYGTTKRSLTAYSVDPFARPETNTSRY